MGSAQHRALERARTLIELGRPVEAERIVRAVVAEAPEAAAPLLVLGRALMDQERHGEALGAIEAAVARGPDDELGHRLRSIVLRDLRRHDEAVAAAAEAVRRAPHAWETHYTLGMALGSGPRPRLRDALACVNEAVRLAPHESAPHNLAGRCLDALRMPEEAERAYREAVRLDPTDAMAINNLAVTEADKGRLRSAARLVTSGLGVDPQQDLLQRNHASLWYRLALRADVALVLLAIVLGALAATAAPYAVRASVTAVAFGAGALGVRAVSRQLPRGARPWSIGLLRRGSGAQRTIVVLALILVPAVLALGVAPRPIALGVGITLAVMAQIAIPGFVVLVFVKGAVDAVRYLVRRGG